MKTRKLLSLLLAAALALALLAGCGGNNSGNAGGAGQAANNASDTNEPAGNNAGGAEEEDTALDPDENYETGDASLDDPRNQDGIGEKELLVVSFGTSYNDSRRLTIGAIEAAMAEAFPDWSVRRAFTSQIIIDHVASRDGVAIDNVTQALDRAVDNGVKTLVVQPTHLMNGLEYEEMVNTLRSTATPSRPSPWASPCSPTTGTSRR